MNLYQPPYCLSPWTPQLTGLNTEAAIVLAWQKLHAEDLYKVVFHENPAMPLAQFVFFFSQQTVALQLCLDMREENEPRLAGMVWLADITDLSTHRRATGSFVFFKDYQTPRWTTQFARMTLDYWFMDLNVGLLIGVTPEPNRAARAFSVRNLKVNYSFTLPQYTTYDGKRADAKVIVLTKEKYLLDRQRAVALQEVKAEV